MATKLSEDMQRAVEMKVRSKVSEAPILDVSAVAEEIRQAFVERNVAHEDIAAAVMQLAAQRGYAVELGTFVPQPA